MGTLIPVSGGEYTYFLEGFGPLHHFFGPLIAFIYIWVTIFVVNPSSMAVTSLSFATYFLKPILDAVDFCPENVYLSYVVTRITAAAFIGAIHPSIKSYSMDTQFDNIVQTALIAFINCYSIKLATSVQFIFTAAKLVGVSIVIGGGVYYIAIGHY